MQGGYVFTPLCLLERELVQCLGYLVSFFKPRLEQG